MACTNKLKAGSPVGEADNKHCFLRAERLDIDVETRIRQSLEAAPGMACTITIEVKILSQPRKSNELFSMEFRIGALVLAAGFARRFGGAKLSAPMTDGRSLIDHTLDGIASAIEEILIVSRPGAAETWNHDNWPVLLFEDAEQGMGASLARGISRLPPWDGCLVCLADMPFIRPQTYALLSARLTPENIVIPSHNGRRGNPVAFGRRFFAELAQLRDERGGRNIIRQHQDSVCEIPVNDPAVLMDIDTTADLDRYRVGAEPPAQG